MRRIRSLRSLAWLVRSAVVVLAISSLMVCAACASSGIGAASSKDDASNGKRLSSPAMALTIAEAAFHQPKVMMAKSMPPQFTVVMQREMPTPGWSFVVDEVEIDEQGGRIVARVSEIGPAGITAQVITDTDCHIPLGVIAKGRYLLEVRLRRGATGEHGLAQALVIYAR